MITEEPAFFAVKSFSKCALAPPLKASIRPRSSACCSPSFPLVKWLGPIASAGAEISALSGRNFCSFKNQHHRLQAQESFHLSKIVSLMGFMLLALGVGLGFYVTLIGRPTPDSAYLSSAAGLLTEFISGVFFYLYNRTLQQVNRFHDKLVAMQQLSLSFLATSLIDDPAERDAAKRQLANAIIPFEAISLEERPTTRKRGASARSSKSSVEPSEKDAAVS